MAKRTIEQMEREHARAVDAFQAAQDAARQLELVHERISNEIAAATAEGYLAVYDYGDRARSRVLPVSKQAASFARLPLVGFFCRVDEKGVLIIYYERGFAVAGWGGTPLVAHTTGGDTRYAVEVSLNATYDLSHLTYRIGYFATEDAARRFLDEQRAAA